MKDARAAAGPHHAGRQQRVLQLPGLRPHPRDRVPLRVAGVPLPAARQGERLTTAHPCLTARVLWEETICAPHQPVKLWHRGGAPALGALAGCVEGAGGAAGGRPLQRDGAPRRQPRARLQAFIQVLSAGRIQDSLPEPSLAATRESHTRHLLVCGRAQHALLECRCANIWSNPRTSKPRGRRPGLARAAAE